jgi:WD40 repeat protein
MCLGRDRWAVLEASLAEPHYIKCVDLWRGPGVIVAAGQATGRVSLVSFGPPDPVLTESLRRTEFSPKQPRNCAALAWHPTEQSLLAVGFDRMRSDCGVLVWDVAASEGRLVEVGQPGDHCSSLAWSGRSSYLAAGLNGRTVRLFDTRANPQKHLAGTQTKATFGLRQGRRGSCEVLHDIVGLKITNRYVKYNSTVRIKLLSLSPTSVRNRE